MKDFLGRDIEPGSFIVYGRRNRNSSITKMYVVERVKEKSLGVREIFPHRFGLAAVGEASILYYPENSVVINDIPENLKVAYGMYSKERIAYDSV